MSHWRAKLQCLSFGFYRNWQQFHQDINADGCLRLQSAEEKCYTENTIFMVIRLMTRVLKFLSMPYNTILLSMRPWKLLIYETTKGLRWKEGDCCWNFRMMLQHSAEPRKMICRPDKRSRKRYPLTRENSDTIQKRTYIVTIPSEISPPSGEHFFACGTDGSRILVQCPAFAKPEWR